MFFQLQYIKYNRDIREQNYKSISQFSGCPYQLSVPYHSFPSLPSLVPSFPSTHIFFLFGYRVCKQYQVSAGNQQP